MPVRARSSGNREYGSVMQAIWNRVGLPVGLARSSATGPAAGGRTAPRGQPARARRGRRRPEPGAAVAAAVRHRSASLTRVGMVGLLARQTNRVWPGMAIRAAGGAASQS